MPKQAGCVNARVLSVFTWNGKRGQFDGTFPDLVRAAVAIGAGVDDVVEADFGGDGQDCKPYRLESAPHDNRAGGLWPVRLWLEE